jgi:hypothetical protein
MESTGVFWIPLYELLEKEGLNPKLVDARHVKNVSGRKSDVLDCQWIQQLHSCGLLGAAFRPDDQICVLRSYMRQREMLISAAGEHIQHMQKALTQMNLKLQHVVSDISGETGLRIIRAIVKGERNPRTLAKMRDPRCQQSVQTIASALQGSYRPEHVFALKQALELYDTYQQKITACDQQIEAVLKTFNDQSGGEEPPPNGKRIRKGQSGNAPAFNLRSALYRLTGVDLTAIPGMDALSATKFIAEVGTDMSKWGTDDRFASWMNICPGTRISGKRRLSSHTRKSGNRAGQILKVCAQSLRNSKSSLGAYYRAMRARVGAASAITMTAHKLARIIFAMLKNKTPYKEIGEQGFLEQRRERTLRSLTRRAKSLGFTLTAIPA